MPIRICVAGATGWAGSPLTRRILQSQEFQLVGAIARRAAGRDVGDVLGLPAAGVEIAATLEDALRVRTDVLIDYTHPSAVKARILSALDCGVRVIVGTSGLVAADYEKIGRRAEERGLGVIAAGNFSITAALAKHFSLLAARYLPSWEIIDYAHAGKVDAPSGTTQELAEALGQVASNKLGLPIESTRGPKRGARGQHRRQPGAFGAPAKLRHSVRNHLWPPRRAADHPSRCRGGRGALRCGHAARNPPRDGDHRPGARAGHAVVPGVDHRRASMMPDLASVCACERSPSSLPGRAIAMAM